MASERRQMIIVAVLVGLLVVLFFVGVGLGATHHDATNAVGSWRSRLNGLDPATTLDPAQLKTVGSCSIDVAASQLHVTGVCRGEIPATAGRFALRGRRLFLSPDTQSVSFHTQIEGQSLNGKFAAGETKELGFGRGAARDPAKS